MPRASVLIVVSLIWPLGSESLAQQTDHVNKLIAPVVKQHCLKCHDGTDDAQSDVNLKQATSDRLSENPELLQQLIRVLDLQEMPPEDEPQLPANTRSHLLTELRKTLHASTARQSAAAAPIRRMNRFQYNNAVIDLFSLKCIVFTLPERMMRVHKNYFRPETGKMADVVTVGNRPLGKSQMIERRLAGVAAFPQDLRAEHGYDNRGDHLSLSPLLMESFLKLGQSITQSPDFTKKNVGIWNTFFAEPKEDSDRKLELKKRLEPFLSRAFRRPADEATVNRYVSFAELMVESGVSFTNAMKGVAAATIASPKFLYLYDNSVAAAGNPTDFGLASRLSFFLWSTLPDRELLDLAAAGQLREPDVLEAQFNRMLKHRKLKRFCDSFPAQWLQLDRLISSVPNRKQYPGFYFLKYRDSMHMMLEPLLLFETVLIENQSITQFIDSDFTYRSGLLEQAYGPLATSKKATKRGGGVTALKFHRVPVKDRRNGGLITNAAVMTMTSGPERTQPITRGAWIAGVIFNNPPEPPPADVPALDEKPPEAETHLTLRERLSMHRKRSDCRGCHEQIDPLGFALENYNPIGVWRDKYENDRDVDMSGTLFREHDFKDVVQFKDAILAEKDRFTRGLAGHLLSYALARELTPSDQLPLDKIAAATAADGYQIQTLLKQVILSKPFLNHINTQAVTDQPRDE
jgi:hypothetical protein